MLKTERSFMKTKLGLQRPHWPHVRSSIYWNGHSKLFCYTKLYSWGFDFMVLHCFAIYFFNMYFNLFVTFKQGWKRCVGLVWAPAGCHFVIIVITQTISWKKIWVCLLFPKNILPFLSRWKEMVDSPVQQTCKDIFTLALLILRRQTSDGEKVSWKWCKFSSVAFTPFLHPLLVMSNYNYTIGTTMRSSWQFIWI